MQEVYSVTVAIQWLYDGNLESYRVKTFAQSKEDAEVNIRDRFRTAYYVKVKEVK
tara:strand:+ start:4239 stop:4403 length:165 start_codon:yes stop_codon:yes gene_type:complete